MYRQKVQKSDVFAENEQILLNSDDTGAASAASKAIINDTRLNSASLTPSQILNRSKLMLSFVVSGIYSKDKRKIELLSDNQVDYTAHFNYAYINASINPKSLSQYLKFLKLLEGKFNQNSQSDVNNFIIATNQNLALTALSDYSSNPSTLSVLNNSITLLSSGSFLSEKDFFSSIDVYAQLLKSKNPKVVKIASNALQELNYGKFSGSQDYARKKLEALLNSGVLSKESEDIVDNNKVLGSPFERKLKKIESDLNLLIKGNGNLKKTKLDIDKAVAFLDNNKDFATNTNYKNGKSPAMLLYSQLTDIADFMKNTLKLTGDERKFVNIYIPKKLDKLKDIDRNISTKPASKSGNIDDTEAILNNRNQDKPTNPENSKIVNQEEKERLRNKVIYDDNFSIPESKSEDLTSEAKVRVSKYSAYIKDAPFSEGELELAIKTFNSGENALVISKSREETAVENSVNISPALRYLFNYTINTEFDTSYRSGADKQTIINNFNRGYWDLVSNEMTASNRLKGLEAIGGIKSQRMEQKVYMRAVPFSVDIAFRNKNLFLEKLEAERSGHGGIFFGYSINDIPVPRVNVSGTLTTNKGEKLTNYQNFFSDNMKSKLMNSINSDSGVNGIKLSKEDKSKISSIINGEAISIIQLNSICKILGYTYSNGSITPSTPKVSFSTVSEVVALFNQAFGGYREIEQVGSDNLSLLIHAMFDLPLYFLIPPKGIFKGVPASLRSGLFKPYLAVGQFSYLGVGESKNLIDLKRGFGITEMGFKVGLFQDALGNSTSVLDADLTLNMSWKKELSGKFGKANYDIRAASPSIKFGDFETKAFYRGIFGGKIPEGVHTLGIFLIPDGLWANDAPWFHAAGNFTIDLTHGSVFSAQLNTSFDLSDKLNFLVQGDYLKFPTLPASAAVKIGVNYNF